MTQISRIILKFVFVLFVIFVDELLYLPINSGEFVARKISVFA